MKRDPTGGQPLAARGALDGNLIKRTGNNLSLSLPEGRPRSERSQVEKGGTDSRYNIRALREPQPSATSRARLEIAKSDAAVSRRKALRPRRLRCARAFPRERVAGVVGRTT